MLYIVGTLFTGARAKVNGMPLFGSGWGRVELCLGFSRCDKILASLQNMFGLVCNLPNNACSLNQTVQCMLELQYSLWVANTTAPVFPATPYALPSASNGMSHALGTLS